MGLEVTKKSTALENVNETEDKQVRKLAKNIADIQYEDIFSWKQVVGSFWEFRMTKIVVGLVW